MSKIEWRDIPNHEGYMVNNLGEVWSKDRQIEKKNGDTRYIVNLKGKKLKTWKSNTYLYCSLGKSIKTGVHRLICMSFHGIPKDKTLEVAHLDGNAHNNTPENLTWATPLENNQMKRLHGTYYQGKAHFKKPGEKKRGPKPSIHPDAQKIIEMRKNGAKWKQIAEAFGISVSGAFGIVKFRSGANVCL